VFDRIRVPIADDEAWLRAMLDVEAALATAQARIGLASAHAAAAVAAACRSSQLDAAAIGREAADTGTPVVPLVHALRNALDGEAAELVHRGATSQDVVDTATMLLARDSLREVEGQLASAAAEAARLARTHRDTSMVARTLLQQALPTTFGLTAAGWMAGLDDARLGLATRRGRMPVQLGGAGGTLAAFGDRGVALVEQLAAELGLVAPVLPWHTRRGPIADLAGALGVAAGAVAKPARDIVLLSQTEVAEVAEGRAGRGGSSALPRKRNAIAAVSTIAAARQAPGLVATILAQMEQEHERAAGAWHAEWLPLRHLFSATASAAAWLADSLATLEVDEGAMATNLARSDGAILGERIVAAITPIVGGSEAERLVGGAEPFDVGIRRAFAADPRLAELDVEELLDPRGYLGLAGQLVDRALAAHAGATSAEGT
jgi:3-carboxy-cis,cis-muconate cycloisomerase